MCSSIKGKLYEPLLYADSCIVPSSGAGSDSEREHMATAAVTEYPGKMTTYVFVVCLMASAGGLTFGYDMGISGGVTSMDSFLTKFFPGVLRDEKRGRTANSYCRFDSHRLTMFTSSLYVAALTSSFFVSIITRAFGRKWSMFCGGLIFLMGSALDGMATNFSMLVAGRALIGVGVGFALQSVPVYLSEMAPTRFRGRINIIFQLMLTIGILVANAVNYGVAKIKGGWGWRVSLALSGVPGIIITLGSLALPDTPNSLIARGYKGKAKTMLQRIRGVIDVQAEFDDMVAACEKAKTVHRPWSTILERRYRPQLTMAILIPFFQQLTGINIIIFYAPIVLKTVGLGSELALLSSVLIGLVNVLATLVSIAFVDSLGRRFLFLLGGWQMFASQLVVGTLIGLTYGTTGTVTKAVPKSYAVLIVALICIYVASFAVSWGALGWLVPSEVFPLEIRSVGQSITVSVSMLLTFLVAQVFMSMLCRMKFGIFYFFDGWVAIMTIFVAFFLPETKNAPMEDMVHIWKSHWFWGRFMPDEENV